MEWAAGDVVSVGQFIGVGRQLLVAGWVLGGG